METGIRGEMLQWARLEQDVTMRWVRERGGPSPGYQSEVEHQKKREVHSALLERWVRILNITMAFARGEVPTFDDDPAACRGLAADIDSLIGPHRTEWAAMDPMERTRGVLRLVSNRSKQLPRVVLAYVLGLSLGTLDDLVTGRTAITAELMRRISELTLLPVEFFKTGELDRPDRPIWATNLTEAIQLALAKGVTQDDLAAWIQHCPARS